MDPNREIHPEEIRAQQLTRLLALGIRGERRAVDDLIEHLEGPDVEARWKELLESSPEARRFAERLLDGSESVEEVRRYYAASKRGLQEARTPEVRLACLALLFLSIAAAAVQHGEWITTQSRDDVLPVFLELSVATPGAWGELFSKALVA